MEAVYNFTSFDPHFNEAFLCKPFKGERNIIEGYAAIAGDFEDFDDPGF
jgi:hypothetical protein